MDKIIEAAAFSIMHHSRVNLMLKYTTVQLVIHKLHRAVNKTMTWHTQLNSWTAQGKTPSS